MYFELNNSAYTVNLFIVSKSRLNNDPLTSKGNNTLNSTLCNEYKHFDRPA